jgi:hypothetical protein
MHLSGFGKYPFIKTHGQLAPLLEAAAKKKAWICITYHTIGVNSLDSSYPFEDWQEDMSEIKERNYWTAPMNSVISYILERNSTQVYARFKKEGGRDQIVINVDNEFEDNLENQELTIKLEIPEDWVNVPLDVHHNGEYLRASIFATRSALLNILPESGEYALTPRLP